MRHKRRQCKVCGRSFVDRTEKSETCFECRSRAATHVPKTSLVHSPSLGPVIPETAAVPKTAAVPESTAAQLPVSDSSPPPERLPNPDSPKLWQQDSKDIVSAARTTWVSPPFKVGFEDFGESDLLYDAPPPPARPRQTMRVRDKVTLAAAVILFYFVWPVSRLHTPENYMVLSERAPVRAAAAPQPDTAPSEPPPAGVRER